MIYTRNFFFIWHLIVFSQNQCLMVYMRIYWILNTLTGSFTKCFNTLYPEKTQNLETKKVSVGKGAEAEPLPKKVSTTPCPLQLKSQPPFISPFIRPKGFISPPPFCSFFEMFQVPPCWGCMLTSKKVVSITIKYFDWVFKHFGDYDQWIWSFENSSSS